MAKGDRYIEYKDGIKRGSALVAPNDEWMPANDPSCNLTYIKLDDAEEEPADGSTLVDGNWVAPVPRVPTTQEKAQAARARRNALIKEVEGEYRTRMIESRVDQSALGPRAQALRTYIQALRDVPKQDGFPDTINWPTL